MKFAYFASALLAVFPVAFAAESHSPAVAKRADGGSEIMNILTKLRTSTQGILPQINFLSQSGNATEDNITPFIDSLTEAANSAGTALKQLQTSKVSIDQSQAHIADVSNILSSIIVDITTTLNRTSLPQAKLDQALGLNGRQGGLLSGLDAALGAVLTIVEALLSGVLTLVAGLVTGVAALVIVLGFTLIAVALGLAS